MYTRRGRDRPAFRRRDDCRSAAAGQATVAALRPAPPERLRTASFAASRSQACTSSGRPITSAAHSANSAYSGASGLASAPHNSWYPVVHRWWRVTADSSAPVRTMREAQRVSADEHRPATRIPAGARAIRCGDPASDATAPAHPPRPAESPEGPASARGAASCAGRGFGNPVPLR